MASTTAITAPKDSTAVGKNKKYKMPVLPKLPNIPAIPTFPPTFNIRTFAVLLWKNKAFITSIISPKKSNAVGKTTKYKIPTIPTLPSIPAIPTFPPTFHIPSFSIGLLKNVASIISIISPKKSNAVGKTRKTKMPVLPKLPNIPAIPTFPPTFHIPSFSVLLKSLIYLIQNNTKK